MACVSIFDQWKVTVPEGERVRLTFTSFDLFPEACGDFVQVYDGFNTGSPSLGKHDVIRVSGMQRRMHKEK